MVKEDHKINEGRRKALKKIAAGTSVLIGYSILPEEWSLPIIQSVVLPAHAATSGEVPPPPVVPSFVQCTIEWLDGDQLTQNISFVVTGSITPAGIYPIQVAFSTVGVVDSGTFPMNTDPTGVYSIGIGPVSGPGYTQVTVVVTSTAVSGSTTCSIDVPPSPQIP
ncbi:MAG: hypothetical protein F9K32_14865 [Desulfobulbaceae bacterium]|nr:MAG: hypothetical protein F9K32_14865 [Desulfobulbaceae bacterium]